jgi:hypothetical protein
VDSAQSTVTVTVSRFIRRHRWIGSNGDVALPAAAPQRESLR